MGLQVWETATGRELASFVRRQQDDQTEPRYMTARFTPDGQRLIAFEEHGIGILDVAAHKETSRPVRVELNNAWLSVISLDGRLAATGNYVPLQPANQGDPRSARPT